VRQDQRLDPGLLRDPPRFLHRRVRADHVLEQLLRVAGDRRSLRAAIDARVAAAVQRGHAGGGPVRVEVDRLVHQHVAAPGEIDHALHRRGVAGKGDRAARRV
jgi:hypothetical protein